MARVKDFSKFSAKASVVTFWSMNSESNAGENRLKIDKKSKELI